MVKDLKAAGGSKSQLREQFARCNALIHPLAVQVFTGFAAGCNGYDRAIEKRAEESKRKDPVIS